MLRGGAETEVPAQDLVPGDVVPLGAGDKVPADGRLIETVNLKLNESALTGESVPVDKVKRAISGRIHWRSRDRHNMAFAGTAVTYGTGRALVVATGMNTEFGKIARMLEGVDDRQDPAAGEPRSRGPRPGRRGARRGHRSSSCSGLLRGASLMEMLMFGIALAVAVVPEALPAVVTISLALGVERMIKRSALVRRLPAVETLGAITVILFG